jgi:hypothetical protein
MGKPLNKIFLNALTQAGRYIEKAKHDKNHPLFKKRSIKASKAFIDTIIWGTEIG